MGHSIYHFDVNNNIVECNDAEHCNVQPRNLHQYHGYLNDINKHYSCQEYIRECGRNYAIFNPIGSDEVNVELIGNMDTIIDRIVVTAKRKSSYDKNLSSYQAWLQDTEGRPIAFIKYMINANRNVIELCDIEVRPEYRGYSLGKHFINAISSKYSKPVIHEGGYTQDGLKYIAGMFNHSENEMVGLSSSTYGETTFVLDWDNMWPKYGL